MEPSFVPPLLYGILLLLIATLHQANGFGFSTSKSDKVLLEDVQTLTLHQGRKTTGRRSSPVQQMSCVGGSAGCSAFQPQVIQCYNRGSDGYDVQWECNSDMDNAYRFGKVEVVCEGYDYAEDPYILTGSCGLEYTLDLTKEGMSQRNKQHNYYGGSGGGGGNSYGGGHYDSYSNRQSSTIGNWIMFAICGLIIYGIYKSCVTSRHTGGTHPGDDPSHRGGNFWGGGGGGSGGGNPPPPGFRPEYQPDSCSGTASGSSQAGAAAGGGGLGAGNFWTGAAAGGLMGYLFGNGFGGYNRGYGGRGWGGGGYGYSRPRTYRQPSYGSGFSGFGGGGGGFSSGSTGTRTASGFGGTRRR